MKNTENYRNGLQSSLAIVKMLAIVKTEKDNDDRTRSVKTSEKEICWTVELNIDYSRGYAMRSSLYVPCTTRMVTKSWAKTSPFFPGFPDQNNMIFPNHRENF